MLVQRRCANRAALRFMCKLPKKQGFAPKLLGTDKLRCYASAFRRLGLTWPHEQGIRKNSRAENSRQGARRRERKAATFQTTSIRPALPSMHAAVHNTFNFQRHLVSRSTLRNSAPTLPRSGKVLSRPHDTWSALSARAPYRFRDKAHPTCMPRPRRNNSEPTGGNFSCPLIAKLLYTGFKPDGRKDRLRLAPARFVAL
jgi:hypothetical protein